MNTSSKIQSFRPGVVLCLTSSHPIPWIAVVSALLAIALSSLVGCGGADPASSGLNVGTTREAIYAGTPDVDGTPNDGVVSVKIGNGTSFELCTGSLLAPNLVLTARHCVSKSITDTVSCNENGESGNGDQVGDDEDLATLHVYTGAKPALGSRANAGVKTIVHPDSGVLCNADIALLVLDANITTIAPMKVRLSSKAHSGETVRAVGYGENDDRLPVGTRLRKDAVRVLAVGQGVSGSQTPLGSHEFEVGLSICQGDSGGPAISEQTGAVIGVVSRGGGCDDDFGHIYTATSGFKALFDQSFATAGATPLDEGLEPEADDPSATTTNDAPPSVVHHASGGCTVGSGPQNADTFAWLLALVALGLKRKRAH